MDITEHYNLEAQKFGEAWQSTMPDFFIRNSEIEIISQNIRSLMIQNPNRVLKILEIGAGNGYVISRLKCEFPSLEYLGIDINHKLISIAQNRQIVNTQFKQCDVLKINTIVDSNQKFDLVFTIRTIINLQNVNSQIKALELILGSIDFKRIIFIECFQDEHERYNNLRKTFGLGEIDKAWHNLYLENEQFFSIISNFKLKKSENFEELTHFLSSHYLATRVLSEIFNSTKNSYLRDRNNANILALTYSLAESKGFSPIRAMIYEKQIIL